MEVAPVLTAFVRSHARRSAPSLLVVLGMLLGAAVLAAPAQAERTCSTARSAGDEPSPLRGICDYLDGRDGVVQVALFDQKSDRLYRLSNGDNTQYTASIVKVDILARWLRRYQRQGAEIPDEIPYSIKYLMQRMIQNSDNAAATSLFYFGGGCDALTRFNTLIPLDDTKVGCQTPTYYGWGNTTTTAADQVRLMKVFAYGMPTRVLGPDARSYGRQLMQGVEPDQRFGISCGPWGRSCDPPDYARPDPDVTVALKNGWKTLPTCTQPIDQCPWQVNSTGWVRGNGRNYVLTVLTTRDPVGTGGLYGYNYGIDTIQNVSERVWDNLGGTGRRR
jgi:hypothetical protein